MWAVGRKQLPHPLNFSLSNCMSKFQIIFLHVQYKNSKQKSLILINTNFAVRYLQLGPISVGNCNFLYAFNFLNPRRSYLLVWWYFHYCLVTSCTLYNVCVYIIFSLTRVSMAACWSNNIGLVIIETQQPCGRRASTHRNVSRFHARCKALSTLATPNSATIVAGHGDNLLPNSATVRLYRQYGQGLSSPVRN